MMAKPNKPKSDQSKSKHIIKDKKYKLGAAAIMTNQVSWLVVGWLKYKKKLPG